MRVSTRLTAVVSTVFLIVAAVGALAFERFREAAEFSVESQARNMAGAMAAMAAFEAFGKEQPGGPASFQNVVNFIVERERRDIEIVDRQLVIVADAVREDIGTRVDGARGAIIALTLKDGQPRTLTETSPAGAPDLRQVVVPVLDGRRQIVAALVYEYSPLYQDLSVLAWHSFGAVGAAVLAGLVLAFGCGIYVRRTISRPLGLLGLAAARLARGERGVQVDLDPRGEIGELAAAFNHMSQSLRASQAALEHRASELLRANQDLHLREQAIESCFNAIVIADLTRPGFPIEYVNPAFSRITGYSAADALGQSANFLTRDDDQPALQEMRAALVERREAHAVLRSYTKQGKLFWNEIYLAPVRNDAGEPAHCVAIFNDITDARNDAELVTHQAQFDALTGLANRSLLHDRLSQAIASAGRREDSVVVAFIDLDNFKLVNDNLGHDVGDELLKAIALRLQACVRASDTVARLGGDEFVLVLQNLKDQHDGSLEAHITRLMQQVLTSIDQPLMLAGHDVQLSCSIGVDIYPQDGRDAETLMKNADTAMYRAKELGRNGFQFFTTELHDRVRQQMALGASLRLALEREEFELHYQPQVSLRSGKVVGAEALLRWNHPQLGLVGPANFIAFAEDSGLIIPIGEWVLMRACAQNKAWQDAGLAPIPVAVNVSARQCAHASLEAAVRHALDSSGLAPRYLELELTESISMADPAKSVPLMERMKEIGVELSIDDFGTGYSNMSYLKRFPIDRLKLDMSFVRDITTDPGSLAISDAIITMSHSLHLEVVAEGVETEGQLALLASLGCDLMQGYFFSRPIAAAAMTALLAENRRLDFAVACHPPDAPAVLVLDDDPHILGYLDLMLAAEGYAVYSTSDPREAFELLARREIAVLLCDQRMPAMSGVEVLSRVRRMYPVTVRVMLSAYEDYSATRAAINMGAVYKFIEKPLQADELKEVVEEAFGLYLGARAGLVPAAVSAPLPS